MDYSAKRITPELVDEIKNALRSISYGSIEIYVQNNVVTQITIRNIKKTSVTISSNDQPIKETNFSPANSSKPKFRVLTIKK